VTKKPWMPLYIGDYLRKTTHLDATGSGAYLHLIMHYWDHGSLPDDDRELARIAKLTTWQYKKLRKILVGFFQPGWRHKRIEEELQRFEAISEKRSRAGVIGAATRQANAKRLLKPGHTQSQSPKNITTTETVPRESKKGASRGSKDGSELGPTPELVETMKRKGQIQ